jgi:hypothetical protein
MQLTFRSPLDALALAVDMLNACTDDEFDDEGWELIALLTTYCTKQLA